MNTSAGDMSSPSNTSDTTDYPIPKDRYGELITWDGNPASLAGIMFEINKWVNRTGNYKVLFENRAVPLSNGALAIDQPNSIKFIEKLLPNAAEYSFYKPCPPTVQRLALYNMKALAATPRFATATPTNTPVPKEQSRAYIASGHKIDEQLRKLMGSMAHVFQDRDAASAMIDLCDGDGFKFLEHWRAEGAKAKPSDLALVTTLRDAAYSRGIPGELTYSSLNQSLKDFLKIERTPRRRGTHLRTLQVRRQRQAQAGQGCRRRLGHLQRRRDGRPRLRHQEVPGFAAGRRHIRDASRQVGCGDASRGHRARTHD